MWDLMGKDTILFHHTAEADPDSMASQDVAQSRPWFEVGDRGARADAVNHQAAAVLKHCPHVQLDFDGPV